MLTEKLHQAIIEQFSQLLCTGRVNATMLNFFSKLHIIEYILRYNHTPL